MLRVRKLIGANSGTYYAIFNDGELKTPIKLLDEFEIEELKQEIDKAQLVRVKGDY